MARTPRKPSKEAVKRAADRAEARSIGDEEALEATVEKTPLDPPQRKPLTPRQAAFAMAYVETGNASEAYRRAYESSREWTQPAVAVEACRMLSNPNIALMVAELQERAAAVAVLNRAWVLQRLMRNADEAIKSNDMNASNKALELLGKVDVMGLFVERVETDNKHNHTVEPVSAFASFLAEAEGAGAEGDPEKPLPN